MAQCTACTIKSRPRETRRAAVPPALVRSDQQPREQLQYNLDARGEEISCRGQPVFIARSEKQGQATVWLGEARGGTRRPRGERVSGARLGSCLPAVVLDKDALLRVPHPPTRLRNGSLVLMPSSLSVTVVTPSISHLVLVNQHRQTYPRIHSTRPHVTPSLDAPSDIRTRET